MLHMKQKGRISRFAPLLLWVANWMSGHFSWVSRFHRNARGSGERERRGADSDINIKAGERGAGSDGAWGYPWPASFAVDFVEANITYGLISRLGARETA